MSDEIGLFPDEPLSGGWGDTEVLGRLIRWAGERKASDIKIVPTGPVSIRVHGKYYRVTKEVPSRNEMSLLLEGMTGNRATAASAFSGSVENFSYRVPRQSGDRRSGFWRLRCVATSALMPDGDEFGLSLTMRFIPDVIPEVSELGISSELLSLFLFPHGLASISGVMGSGKTTTLAAVMGHIIKTRQDALMSLESPIEFDLGNVPGALGVVEQMEVPRMVRSFDLGIESATRKAVDVLLVGETNNRATMEAMIKAAEIGIAVYHTVHTSSVAAIPPRIIHSFSAEEAPGIAVSFCGAAHLLLQQRLLPRAGGGRVALREWLSLTEEHRQILIDTPHNRLFPVLEGMVQRDGHSLLSDARELLEQGLIEESEYHKVEVEKMRVREVLDGHVE